MRIKPLDRSIFKEHITINTIADAIDKKHIYIYCPICNKSKYSRSKVLHIHKSSANLSNRLEVRKGHCSTYDTTFNISITDDTQRL